MHEAVKTFVHNGLTIRILQDDSAQSPDEDGNEDLFLVGFHRDFTVGRDGFEQYVAAQAYKDRDKYLDIDLDVEQIAHVREVKKKYWIIGLEAYIHSGVSLAIAREGNFPDRRWDVSQVGAVFVEKKTWKTLAKARKAASGLIAYWNQYLSGEVYGFQISKTKTCPTCKHEEEEELDSCWGFVGDVKYCEQEARAAAEGLE